LLKHFGEAPAQTCGNCDNCLNPPKAFDVTQLARKFLSAVYRTGQSFGVGHLENILTGKADAKAEKFGHDKLSVFGIATAEEAALIKPVARSLLLKDALRNNEHGGLIFGPEAKAYMKGEIPLGLVLPPKTVRQGRSGQAPNPVGDPLFEALRHTRRVIAVEAGVPPYVVFHDATLREMADERPSSMTALSRISGVGARKLEAYGEAFLAVISQH
jgi:ATP-dependent DNA helicase RecQ